MVYSKTKVAFLLIGSLSLGLSGAAFGSESGAAVIEQLGGSDHAIKTQFGHTDPESISVVQKRYFSKAKRHSFRLNIGNTFSGEPYLEVNELGATYRYYTSNTFGFGASYRKYFRSVSSDYNKLISDVSVSPEIILPEMAYGLDAEFVPVYAKMNFFDKNIIRMEIFVEGGPHFYQTELQNHIALHYGAGFRFMPSNSFTFSLGVSNYLFRQERAEAIRVRHLMAYSANVTAWLGSGE